MVLSKAKTAWIYSLFVAPCGVINLFARQLVKQRAVDSPSVSFLNTTFPDPSERRLQQPLFAAVASNNFIDESHVLASLKKLPEIGVTSGKNIVDAIRRAVDHLNVLHLLPNVVYTNPASVDPIAVSVART